MEEERVVEGRRNLRRKKEFREERARAEREGRSFSRREREQSAREGVEGGESESRARGKEFQKERARAQREGSRAQGKEREEGKGVSEDRKSLKRREREGTQGKTTER